MRQEKGRRGQESWGMGKEVGRNRKEEGNVDKVPLSHPLSVI